jgi:succinyl-CoA synthetase beta subunit
LAHKSEAGAVIVGLTPDAVEARAKAMPTDSFLVEEMVENPVAELLIGVTRDPAHGFLLTIGAGGVLTELWQDTVSMLLPVTSAQIQDSLQNLRIAPLLNGYRGKPGADLGAITKAIMSVQAYVIAHQDAISEVEVNPLICGTDSAIAVDALIRRT